MSDTEPSMPDVPGLKRIFTYLVCCMLLQISSGSIFGGQTPSTEFAPSDVQNGARFGRFDQFWLNTANYTSSDTFLFPSSAQNAALNMFSARTNDTCYPGLHGRLLHDTVNLAEDLPPSSIARVNASLVNVHCLRTTTPGTTPSTTPTDAPESILADVLHGKLFAVFNSSPEPTAPNVLVNF
ncbi:hypothetical protein DFH06DRAFT_1203452 [Mycena polygramma]|nr:hypothetical protein DFH06DRAFT_1203452 [Mycena polygramma]